VSAQAQPRHFAQAIYDLALETWTRQLGDVQKALKRDADLRAALSDTGAGPSQRLQLLEQAIAGGLDPHVHKFVGTLLEAGQLDQLDTILAELDRLVRRGPARKLAYVTSAVPLTSAEQAAFRDRVTRHYGPDLEIEFDVEPALIGGVVLRVGDQVIDGSVASKLAALRDRLAA
jgi:F-type H+-transporting ATPase subunit delta